MQDLLLSALDTTKRQLKMISLASVAAAWIAATLLILLGFVLWDHWRIGGIPGWAASTLRVLYLLGTILWLTAAVVIPLVRNISDLYAARLIERGHPEFGNVLVGAVQLARREELPGSIRVAIVDQASRQVGVADVRRSVPTGTLRVWALLLAAAIVSFTAYSVLAPKSVLVSIRRALGARLAPPTRTLINRIEPADGLRVLRGQDVTFRVTLGGQAPDEAVIRFSPDGGQTWPAAQQLRLLPTGRPGLWWGTRAGADVQVPLHWQVLAGDAETKMRHLVVLPEPAVVDMSVRYEFPRYTGLSPTTQPGGDIDALVGTRAIVEAHTNVPVVQPVLIVGQGTREQRRVLSQSGPVNASDVLTAEIVVDQDDVYALRFRDADGHPNVPVRNRILARPDQPPMVDWHDATESLEVYASSRLAWKARAQDDFGLSRVVLCCRKAGESATREVSLSPGTWAAGDHVLAPQIVPAELGLVDGDAADLWISVWDNREDTQQRAAYQRADSAIRRLTVRKPPPTTAPMLARADEQLPERAARPAEAPERQTDPLAGQAGETDMGDGDQNNANPDARPDREEWTLKELVNQHERQLAQLEHQLAQEMRNDPGGHIESTLPLAAPERTGRPDGSPDQGAQRGGQRDENSNAAETQGHSEQASASGDAPADGSSHAGSAADHAGTSSTGENAAELQRLAGRSKEQKERDSAQNNTGEGDPAENVAPADSEEVNKNQAGGPADSSSARAGNEKERGEDTGAPPNRMAEARAGDTSPSDREPGATDPVRPGAQQTRPAQNHSVQTRPQDSSGRESGGRAESVDRSQRASREPEMGSAEDDPESGATEQRGRPSESPQESSRGSDQSSRAESADTSQRASREQDMDSTEDVQEGGAGEQRGQQSGSPQESSRQSDQSSRTESAEQPRRDSRDQEMNGAENDPEGATGDDRSRPSESPQDSVRESDQSSRAESADQSQPSSRDQEMNGAENDPEGATGDDRSRPSESPQDSVRESDQSSCPESADQSQPSSRDQEMRRAESDSEGGPNASRDSEDQEDRDSDSMEDSAREQRSGDSTAEPREQLEREGADSRERQEGDSSGTPTRSAQPRESSASGSNEDQTTADATAGSAEDKPPRELADLQEVRPSDHPGGSGEQSSQNGSSQMQGRDGAGSQSPSGRQGDLSNGEQPGSGGTSSQEPPSELGPVGPGSPSAGTGGRSGGVSRALPDEAAQLEDVAPPAGLDMQSRPLAVDGRVDRLVNQLDRELRAGTVDPKLLQDLGWDLPRARQFVEAYKRRKEEGQRQVDRTELPSVSRRTTQPAGEENVLKGTAPPGVSRAFLLDRAHPALLDQLRSVDPARQRVPARFRPLLEAYYRSLSSQPAN